MLRLALLSLILGIIAAVLGFHGIAGFSFAVAEFLFFVLICILAVLPLRHSCRWAPDGRPAPWPAIALPSKRAVAVDSPWRRGAPSPWTLSLGAFWWDRTVYSRCSFSRSLSFAESMRGGTRSFRRFR